MSKYLCIHSFIHKKELEYLTYVDFLSGSVIQNPPANAGDVGSIPGSGRSPGEENGNPPEYSCLGNPMDRKRLVGYSTWGHKQVRYDLSN